MKWLLALVGAAALVAGGWWGLRRIRRPELRVALNLRTGDPDDDALAAGVELALEERDHRAGRWRLKTAHQEPRLDGTLAIPDPCAHTMLHALGPAPLLRAAGDQLLVYPEVQEEAGKVLAFMRTRGLRRLVLQGLFPQARRDPSMMARLAIYRLANATEVETVLLQPQRRVPEADAALILEARPDLLFVDLAHLGTSRELIPVLRKAGYGGPLFLSAWNVHARSPEQEELDGCRVVLTALPPVPPAFQRRHGHPLAYAGYLGTRRYLDALDAAPAADPLQVAWEVRGRAVDLLPGEARLYVFRDGLLVPE